MFNLFRFNKTEHPKIYFAHRKSNFVRKTVSSMIFVQQNLDLIGLFQE